MQCIMPLHFTAYVIYPNPEWNPQSYCLDQDDIDDDDGISFKIFFGRNNKADVMMYFTGKL